jgi:hypothetical protein
LEVNPMRRLRGPLFGATLCFLLGTQVHAQFLFVGLEDSSLPTRTSTLAGFPNVSWVNRFPFEVNGAACAPNGTLYLCNGPFTTRLYRSTLAGPPEFVTNIAVDVHGLGYGRGRLYGFSNYGSPMGIYAIDPVNGSATLAVDTSPQGYRFFGLDYNPLDDSLYGFTEYGTSGLYRIDIDSGEMVRLVSTPPGVGGQGRALAVGNNTVYLLATRGDEGEPCFAYDLAQGAGGSWVAFTNPYPANHNTGGATWIPNPAGIGDAESGSDRLRLQLSGAHPCASLATLLCSFPHGGDARLEIFDTLGRRVATPFSGSVAAGTRAVVWDLRSDEDRRVPGGAYFVRLFHAGDVQTERVVVVP